MVAKFGDSQGSRHTADRSWGSHRFMTGETWPSKLSLSLGSSLSAVRWTDARGVPMGRTQGRMPAASMAVPLVLC
jgi:hypothetical protein